MVKGNMKSSITCALLGLLVVLTINTKMVTCDIPCFSALARLSSCRDYMVGNSPSPPDTCCIAAAELNRDANTKEIRKGLCNCFKQALPVLGVLPDRALALPGLCKVSVPVPISPDVDCNNIN